MKVLIIGGAGFLGNYLCKNCIDERYDEGSQEEEEDASFGRSHACLNFFSEFFEFVKP